MARAVAGATAGTPPHDRARQDFYVTAPPPPMMTRHLPPNIQNRQQQWSQANCFSLIVNLICDFPVITVPFIQGLKLLCLWNRSCAEINPVIVFANPALIFYLHNCTIMRIFKRWIPPLMDWNMHHWTPSRTSNAGWSTADIQAVCR
jgi:hypothetical protein